MKTLHARSQLTQTMQLAPNTVQRIAISSAPISAHTAIRRCLCWGIFLAIALGTIGSPSFCSAAGPLIKPAKWSLKWPFKKKEQQSEGDPFSEYGAAEQRRLASSISGQPLNQHSTGTNPNSPPIQAKNGYQATPGVRAYPWPKPIDSAAANFRSVPPPTGQLYQNTGVPASISQAATTTQPTRPASGPPVAPANPSGSLYPRSRIPGTSVTAPTNFSTVQNSASFPSLAASSPNLNQNGGSLYPSTQYGKVAGANGQPGSPLGTAPILPNYARPKSNTPSIGASQPAGTAAQQTTATFSASRLPSTISPTPQRPSSRLSHLPGRNIASIEAEPTVPKKPITPPVAGSPTRFPAISSPAPVTRIATATAGVPAAVPGSNNGPVETNGPYFDPEKQAHYDDQYGWQRGSTRSSRKQWSDPPEAAGSTQTTSASVPVSDVPAPPANIIHDLPLAPTVTNAANAIANQIIAAPQRAKQSAKNAATSIQSQVQQAVGDVLPLPPTSTPPNTTQSPSPTLPPLLPLPPLTDATDTIKNLEQKTQKSLLALPSASKAAAAHFNETVANVSSQVQQVAHATTSRVHQATSSVMNTSVSPAIPVASPVASPVATASFPAPPTPPLTQSIAANVNAALQQTTNTIATTASNATAGTPFTSTTPVDMTSAWQPDAPATATAATATAATATAATVPTASIPLPPAVPPALQGSPIPTNTTVATNAPIGQTNYASPASPDMSSAYPLANVPVNSVTPATNGYAPDSIATNPPPAPRLDGQFHSGQVDQSIWGGQVSHSPPPPVHHAPPAQPNPPTNVQASATQTVPKPNFVPQRNTNVPTANAIGTNSAAGHGSLDRASQVIAVVGDQSILGGDLLWQIDQMLKPYIGKAPEEELDKQRTLLMEKLLPRLVENKLVYLDFLRTIPRDKLPEVRKQVVEEFNRSRLPKLMAKAEVNTPAEMDAKLRGLGSSLNKQQQQFMEQMVGQQMVQQNVNAKKEVSHEEMLTYYHEHSAEFDITAQTRWERLMVRWDQFPTREEAKRSLAELGNEVLRGSEFGAVAKRGSQGPRSAEGGFYDWTQRDSLKSAKLDELIFTLPVGKLSRVVEDEDGAHILRVIERRESGRIPFDQVQTKITEAIQAERFKTQVEQYLAKLETQTTVWTAFDKKK